MGVLSIIDCRNYVVLTPAVILIVLLCSLQQTSNATPDVYWLGKTHNESASLSDASLKIEVFATGLNQPTNMAFLDSGDILVLEKQNGIIRKISNGSLLSQPLLDVSVATFDTRGMLGLAVAKNESRGVEYLFVYFTQAGNGLGDGEDKCRKSGDCVKGGVNQPSGNVMYRFDLSDDENSLTNRKLLLNFSALPGASHNGGEIVVGPDNFIYVITGNAENVSTVASNSENPNVDGKAGILALNHDGRAAFDDGILGKKTPLNKYYAYGVRNGFGLDFDPISGKLWDTENGHWYGDEINLVEPGFNSGYNKIMGFWERIGPDEIELFNDTSDINFVDFNGKGKYSDPELTWNSTVALTAIKFLNSNKYGNEYQNDIFVGSVLPNGNLYHFDLNSDRTELALLGPLRDKIVGSKESKDILFGENFGVISDITVGPDGYLYIVSLTQGKIYRIIPI
jgi:glucose/arabinose dehydrogenase